MVTAKVTLDFTVDTVILSVIVYYISIDQEVGAAFQE